MANWKYKIKIKELFVDDDKDVTPKLTATICVSLITQLNFIKCKLEKSNLKESDKEEAVSELDEVVDHFEFLRDLSNGTIKEEEWEDYSFDGDYKQWTNDFLSELYDLGDVVVWTTTDVKEKLIWID